MKTQWNQTVKKWFVSAGFLKHQPYINQSAGVVPRIKTQYKQSDVHLCRNSSSDNLRAFFFWTRDGSVLGTGTPYYNTTSLFFFYLCSLCSETLWTKQQFEADIDMNICMSRKMIPPIMVDRKFNTVFRTPQKKRLKQKITDISNKTLHSNSLFCIHLEPKWPLFLKVHPQNKA